MEALEKAEKAFQEKDFLAAHKIYWALYQTGKKMNKAALLYNAGVSAFHEGKHGLAYGILLRAKKLNPSDADILHNLNFIQKDLLKEGALIPETREGIFLFSLLQEQYLPIYFFLFLVSCIVLLLQHFQKIFRFHFIYPTSLSLCILFAVASYASHKIQRKENAVLIEKSVAARSGPRVSFPEISTLREGTMVQATQVKGNWRKIYFIVDKKMEPIVAWVPKKSLFLTQETLKENLF